MKRTIIRWDSAYHFASFFLFGSYFIFLYILVGRKHSAKSLMVLVMSKDVPDYIQSWEKKGVASIFVRKDLQSPQDGCSYGHIWSSDEVGLMAKRRGYD